MRQTSIGSVGCAAGSRAHCLRVLLPPPTPTQDIRNLGREVRHGPTRRNTRSKTDVRTRNRNLSSTKPTARTTVVRSSVSKGLVWVGSLRSNYDDRNPIFRSGILRSLSISTGYKNGRPILETIPSQVLLSRARKALETKLQSGWSCISLLPHSLSLFLSDYRPSAS